MCLIELMLSAGETAASSHSGLPVKLVFPVAVVVAIVVVAAIVILVVVVVVILRRRRRRRLVKTGRFYYFQTKQRIRGFTTMRYIN